MTESGTVLFTSQEIKDGLNVWQSIGGQEIGTVWGHGAYVAPDWSADWLHKETLFLLDKWSKKDFGKLFNDLDPEKQAMLKVRIQKALRLNTYDSKTVILTVSDERAEAIISNSNYYQGLFMVDPSLDNERASYAIPANSIKDSDRMHNMNAFFFWAAWACITNRPESDLTIPVIGHPIRSSGMYHHPVLYSGQDSVL
jgi:nitric oxide reductase subunit B